MKYVLFAAMLLLSAISQARDVIKDSVKVDGHQRPFLLYKPAGLAPDAPLVFVCHGYGGKAGANDNICRAADKNGFAACFPQGLKDPTGKYSWNVGYPMQDGWKMDDVKSLCSIARYVQKKYQLSRENTFFSGLSNGGEMCYLLAYSDQKVFKAFGSVAGLTMEWIYKEKKPVRPVPFLEIHGTNDTTSPMEGDLENKGGWNPFLPVPQAVNAMVAYDRCEIEQRDTVVYQDRPSKRPVVRHKYLRGDEGTEVWFYEVIGGTHSWFTDDLDTGELLWEFFSKWVR